MKPCLSVALSCALFALLSCASDPGRPGPSSAATAVTQGLAFGSCLRQWQPQPVWSAIAESGARGFIFMGDNVYSDVGPYRQMPPPTNIAAAYQDLSLAPQFAAFRQQAQADGMALMATWDDHDYGENDGGGDYPYQRQSRGYFADFFKLDPGALGDGLDRGVYHSRVMDLAGLKVQIILLDTRSFRSPLTLGETPSVCPPTGVIANRAPTATLLGEAQWQWLGQQLDEDADLRLLVSSIQVLPEQHCFEKWANFPRERQRLFELIGERRAKGVVFLSGDRHLGEVSQLPSSAAGYPLYEITASGLNSAVGSNSAAAGEANPLRVAGANLLTDHFGFIAVVRQGADTIVALQLRGVDGQVLRQLNVPLTALQ